MIGAKLFAVIIAAATVPGIAVFTYNEVTRPSSPVHAHQAGQPPIGTTERLQGLMCDESGQLGNAFQAVRVSQAKAAYTSDWHLGNCQMLSAYDSTHYVVLDMPPPLKFQRRGGEVDFFYEKIRLTRTGEIGYTIVGATAPHYRYEGF